VSATETTATVLNLAELGVREVNRTLHDAPSGESFMIANPQGRHAIASGCRSAVTVEVHGHAGYYCAGMNQEAVVRVHGMAGVGVAENMMSGRVEVQGLAGQSAGASAHGGLLVIEGDAAARCGISLKGADIVVKGSVGHASAFMAQSGRLLVLGDAGAALGDSIYEARIYVRGTVSDLGADCVQKPMGEAHLAEAALLLEEAGVEGVAPSELRRYGSGRQLYHWHPVNRSLF
jgi:methylamine---glutamate N-methyltransferase subunit B